jgi:hypothetical protein
MMPTYVTRAFVSIFLFLSAISFNAWSGILNSISLSDLKCENEAAPLGVESFDPALSWRMSALERGLSQTAYQILAATDPALLGEGKADLWDSGKVESASQRAQYSGRQLHSGEGAFWTVRIWLKDGAEPSAFAVPGSWGMGLLSAGDWLGRWIGADAAIPIFRKEFSIADKPVKRAVAYICGLGQFEMSLNGKKVGDHFLDPGWTNYKKTCLYVPFDVTQSLRAGSNAVGVMLGNGMYNVAGGRYTKFTGSFGAPKLIFDLRVEYFDGSVDSVVSDETWRADASPITFTCIYGGEDYDAQMEQHGWDSPGFDDAKWTPAHFVEPPGGELRAQTQPPVAVAETLHPSSIRRTAPGEYIVDLGQNVSARPFLTTRGAKGQSVNIQVSELPDGPWKGHSYTYVLRGDGEETFRPRFTYFGFQYLFISGADRPEDADAFSSRPILTDIGADFVTSSAQKVGAFRCDNELFNDIEAMINRSVRSNLQSVLTDCPHREKLGWLEVSHLMGPSILYHYDVSGLYRKICRDTTESQLENGLVPDIAPEYTRFEKGFFDSPEWGSACVQLPWLLRKWTGDDSICGRQFETMARYVRYLASGCDTHGLAKGGLGDWYDWTPEKGHAGGAQLTPTELTATAMLYDDARIVAETARLLNKPNEATEFSKIAEQTRANFLTAYYNAGAKTVSTGSQASLACALYFGLVREEDRAAILESLVRAVEASQYKPTTGEVCFRYLVQSLAEGGRSDVVYRIVNREDPPGYGCMLRKFHLKTLSEQWDKPGSSLNHCMFGHIQEWFQSRLLGIRQADDSIGFERVRIEPEFVGDLKEADGYFDAPKGRISVHWRKTEQGLELDATIPGNMSADVIAPLPEGKRLLESGVPAKQATGILSVREENGKVVASVGSGSYKFSTTD